jgi:alpha-glucosidase (family GH31 glycosyl hydrolase)
MFGDDFLVAPIFQDRLTNQVHLPKGSWRYFFNDDEVVQGPAQFKKDFPLDEYPVYIREGAIVPMDIKRDYTGIGDQYSEGLITLLIYPKENNSFRLHHSENESTLITSEDNGGQLHIRIEGKKIPHILNIKISEKPETVALDGIFLTENKDYVFDQNGKRLIVTTYTYDSGEYIINK